MLRSARDWRWADQDGGDGRLGTVRSVIRQQAAADATPVTSADSDANGNESGMDMDATYAIVVAWDMGIVGNYSPGDLRVFDAICK